MCHKIPVEVEILNVLTDNINIYAIHASNTMFDSRRYRRRFRVWLDRRFRKIVAFRDTRYSYRSAIKCRVIKLQIVLSEVQNGEIHLGLFLSITLVLLLDASSSPNDLLKLRHRTYNTVQSNNLTGLSIDACAHQTARNGNYRIFRRWVNKVVQLGFTDLIIARDCLFSSSYVLRNFGMASSTADHRCQGVGFASLRVLDSPVRLCKPVIKAAIPPFANEN